jgi:23S rRNA pseudouridine1911/1915/1917 synthase
LLFDVQAESAGFRLDIFLSQTYPDYSRSLFKRIIQEKRVLVNGRPVKPSHETRCGDRIGIWLPAAGDRGQLTAQPIPLDILHEDDDILVVNKPAGLVVHPGAGHEEGTLVHGLLAHASRLALQGSPERPGIVHRLDKDTSGALVVAKTEQAYADLVCQFRLHTVEKEYLALVYGDFAVSAGEIRTLLARHPRDRTRMAVLVGRGREAVSRWRVAAGSGEVSLVRVLIETGRTHQIRVQLSHLEHPVVGDSVYGGGKRRAARLPPGPLRDLLMSVERHLLHAWQLAFQHPRSRLRLSFEAPLPGDFSRVLKGLEQLVGAFASPDLASTERRDRG